MQAIERTFALLRVIATEDSGIGVTRLAERVRLPKGTVSRFLLALENEGAVLRTTENRFVLGELVRGWGEPATNEARLVLRAQPEMVRLSNATGEAIALSILEGNTVHYIAHVASQHQVQVVDWTGRSIPWHTSSSGKLLVACGDQKAWEPLLARPLHPAASKTLVDPDKLHIQLKGIRTTQVARTDEEFADGVVGLAVPLFDPEINENEPIAALTLYGPKYRLGQRIQQADIVSLMQEAAHQITL